VLTVKEQRVDEHRAVSVCRLNVSALYKSFLSPAGERIDVLKGVSFEVNGGDSIAIIGASGAGKSTLLHLLGGLERSDKGQIDLNGVSISNLSTSAAAELRRRQIGFIFQFHHLLSDLTACENVALPLMVSGKSQSEAMARGREALERVGLGQRVDHPITYLSGGEQQRVAVSRALITEPFLVLADEPTGNLDARIGEEISEILVSYAREREAILVMATHNETFAGMCNQVRVLKDGRLDRI
jgi:lipoprotein-releasing system ATP-binding protein